MDNTEGGASHDDEGRDQGGASLGQGMLKAASQPPEARRGIRNRFSLVGNRRNQPSQRLDFELPASRYMRHLTSLVSATAFVAPCYASLSKLTHPPRKK